MRGNIAHKHYLNYARAKKTARRVLADLGYKNPPINPLDIAKKRGIDVSFVSFPNNPNSSGFYDPSEKKIYVNAEEGTRKQAFTIAHKLGHAILHQVLGKMTPREKKPTHLLRTS